MARFNPPTPRSNNDKSDHRKTVSCFEYACLKKIRPVFAYNSISFEEAILPIA